MSASTSRKRKNQPVEKPRPSVFDRLGTKASQSQQQSDARANFCHHWRNTGNCPFGSTCKNANFHTLISPSKRSKGGEKEQLTKEQLNRKVDSRGKKGKGKETWTELNEAELERRKLQLQKELDLQNRQEMKKKSAKKKRSSSSSSSSSTQSSTNTSKNSSVKSNQPKLRRPVNKKRKGKGAVGSTAPKLIKEVEPKRMRENPRDNKKRSGSNIRPEQRSRSKHGTTAPGSASKKRKNSSSSENSSSERRRQQNKTSSHPSSKGKGRSPSPDKKKKPSSSSAYDKKSPPRRRESPLGRRNSPGRSSNRKRSASPGAPRSRRRTPSPRGKIEKKHDLRHDTPPVTRHRSPTPEKKESRRAQTPPSPHDRGHPRGGRNPRRDSPEPRLLPRDSRNRPQGARSPDRRNRAPSREPRESAGDKRDFARRDYNSPAPSRAHVAARISPEISVRPSSRDRREESTRDKSRPTKEIDRERRREGGQEKSRDRGRVRDEELPSLMNLMTQHPAAQYSPRRGRDEPPEHRSSTRERGRYERYEDRGESFVPPVDEHPRSKRTARRESPSRQRPQKAGRDWGEHPEHKDKDWDRRGKAGGSSSHRDWDDQTRPRPSGKGGHRRGPSPTNASPKTIRDIEGERVVDEGKPEDKADEKKSDKLLDDDICEPPSKKMCLDLDDSNLKTIDHVESDFSDFSDDADDILNADVAEDEPANDAEFDSAGGADLDKDDEEPVEDMLEDMDFEEISDGELDAEDIKAGADALSVDWAALLNQTKHTKREESESFVNKWDIGPALSRIGVPLSVKGSFDLQSIGLHPPDMESKLKIEDGKSRCAFLFDDYSKLQDEVPGVHAAIIRKKETIASILNPIYHRGIDCAYGEQLRKICPFKEPDDVKVEEVKPWNNNLHQLALDLLKGNCGLKEVQQRLGIETTNGVKVEC